MRQICSLLLFPVALAAQAAPRTPVPDVTFPAFANGDGRQRLSDFQGHAVLVVTFADVWGGLAASDPAVKLHEAHHDENLVVILTHTPSGGTYADGATDIDLGAWALRRYPGASVRLCGQMQPTWRWQGEMSPFFAVIGPDQCLIASGDVQKGARPMQDAVAAALAQCNKGWGTADEAAARALAFGKGSLAQARSHAPGSVVAEVDAAFARHATAIEWLVADGQWQRARQSSARLEVAAKGIDEWAPRVTALVAMFTTEAAQAELELDAKLTRLVETLRKGTPDKNLHKRLAEFARKSEGSSVGNRAARLTALVAQAMALK